MSIPDVARIARNLRKLGRLVRAPFAVAACAARTLPLGVSGQVERKARLAPQDADERVVGRLVADAANRIKGDALHWIHVAAPRRRIRACHKLILPLRDFEDPDVELPLARHKPKDNLRRLRVNSPSALRSGRKPLHAVFPGVWPA